MIVSVGSRTHTAQSGCTNSATEMLQDKFSICNALMTAYKDNGIKTEAQAEAFLLKVVQVRLVCK